MNRQTDKLEKGQTFRQTGERIDRQDKGQADRKKRTEKEKEKRT